MFRVFCVFRGLSSEQPYQQRQDNADQQAGDDGEMEAEIALGIIDVAGQPSEPAFAKAGPEQRTKRRQHQTGNHQQFAHFIHVHKMALKRAKATKVFTLARRVSIFLRFFFFILHFVISMAPHVARLRHRKFEAGVSSAH
jgi:hypothetical protein